MRFLFALPVAVLLACSSSTSPSSSEDDNDDSQRTMMRSDIEGTWTGAYTFTDGRAATTMTLALDYSGTGHTTPQCGSRSLANAPGLIEPRCITIYSLPLRATLSTADGTHESEATTLAYDNIEGLSGGAATAPISAQLKSGQLQGTCGGANGGTFTLTRAK